MTSNSSVSASQLSFGIGPLGSILLVDVMPAGPHDMFYSLVILFPSLYSLYTLVLCDLAAWPAEDKHPTKLKSVAHVLSV